MKHGVILGQVSPADPGSSVLKNSDSKVRVPGGHVLDLLISSGWRCVNVTATRCSKIQPASHRDKVVRDRRAEKSPNGLQRITEQVLLDLSLISS